jgi:DNA-binding NtrC family response regulator
MAEKHVLDETVPLGASGTRDLKQLLESYERALIVTALAASGGNQRQAAQQLGLLPTTLNEKMKRLGLRGRPLEAPTRSVDPAGALSESEG